mmetsp:Transcript_9283/g.14644  ORF Transcript_9283/g.14644 Transcript_9283/m.14644 type:complete len:276 (+) Transcript_9283:478-1305(+)
MIPALDMDPSAQNRSTDNMNTAPELGADMPRMDDLGLGMDGVSLFGGATTKISEESGSSDGNSSGANAQAKGAMSPTRILGKRGGGKKTMEDGLCLETLDSSPLHGDMRVKMDLLGQGSEGPRAQQGRTSSAGGGTNSDDIGSRRRSRSTLPANFRFDPSRPPQLQPTATGPGSQRGAAAAAGAAEAAGAPQAPGGGLSLRLAGNREFSMSAKERIAEEEEEMAMNMSLHGNPFGPRVDDQQALNTFSWLAESNAAAGEALAASVPGPGRASSSK